jgi:hypothetical protein
MSGPELEVHDLRAKRSQSDPAGEVIVAGASQSVYQRVERAPRWIRTYVRRRQQDHHLSLPEEVTAMNSLSVVVLSLVSLLAVPSSALPQTVYPTGTTIYAEGLAYDGVTFYRALDQRAKLIDMQGTLIHEWWPPVSGDTGFSPLYEPIPEPSGHILALQTKRVSELDWDSHVVWQVVAPVNLGVGDLDDGVIFHHDVVRRANGNTLILCSVPIQVPTISPHLLRDDCILEVTPAGEIVWQWFTFQHVDEFGFSADARQLLAEARNGGDWAHANALSEIPPNHHHDPAFTPGNLLVSYRERPRGPSCGRWGPTTI